MRSWSIPAFGVALVLSACGSRTMLMDSSARTLDDGGVVTGCGDGSCASNESCTTCAVDCGTCAGCGNQRCDANESCASCPEDCGSCETCGDGFCKDGETCLSCAPDCGKCAGCGDKTCDATTEDCFSCPDDCGQCPGCGDGLCRGPETCASCPSDCGLCVVCGNSKCEGPYETCTNCHEDCGDCEVIGCMSMLSCSLGCIDTATRPPGIHASCLGNCVARGCPSAQFEFDNAFNCFVQHANECNADLSCLETACDAEVAACIGTTCAN